MGVARALLALRGHQLKQNRFDYYCSRKDPVHTCTPNSRIRDFDSKYSNVLSSTPRVRLESLICIRDEQHPRPFHKGVFSPLLRQLS